MPLSAPTHSSPLFDQVRFVLNETSHPGNVGSAARAIKTMGFGSLVLAAPRAGADVLRDPDAVALASGADDVLANARVVADLDAALAGVSWAVALSARSREYGPPNAEPRESAAMAVQHAGQGETVAFVFGSERFGLSNEDVYRCHVCLSIPTHPAFGSLNLAQAVQLLAYEWRMSLGGFDVAPRTPDPELASAQAVQGLLEHWREALVHIDYLDPAAPKKLLPRLNQLFNRAQLTQEEVHILRGMAKAMLKR